MTKLLWNSASARFFEMGLDQGVLYTPDGLAVPWNGLVSIDEETSAEFGDPVYYDGQLIYQDALPGTFKASMSAFTFPDEFNQFSGFEEAQSGVLVGNQPVEKKFGLSWRTMVGNGDNVADYKIHVLYGVVAVPSTVSRETMNDESEPLLFTWDLRAVPSPVPGYRPTSHVVIDSRHIDKYRLESVERYLYGGDGAAPHPLGTVADLLSYVDNDVLIRITDNGDGTWTAEGPDDLVKSLGQEWFQITSPDATYISPTTYTISTTEY